MPARNYIDIIRPHRGSNCGMRRFAPRSGRALTLAELLVAVAISSVFLVGIVTALTSIFHTAEIASNKAEAIRNGRTALDYMSREIAEANSLSASPLLRFEGLDFPQATGDYDDNDNDSLVDEEAFDGTDNDGDGAQSHAILLDDVNPALRIYERPRQRGIFEIGDVGVDEDVVFQRDTLTFIRKLQRISYEIATYEGEDNVLIRRTENLISTIPPEPETIDPIAYNVVSLNFLYFNPNWIDDGVLPWASTWNSSTQTGSILYPAMVHVSISVYSGDIPFAEFTPSFADPMPVMTLQTQIALEGVLDDYRANF